MTACNRDYSPQTITIMIVCSILWSDGTCEKNKTSQEKHHHPAGITGKALCGWNNSVFFSFVIKALTQRHKFFPPLCALYMMVFLKLLCAHGVSLVCWCGLYEMFSCSVGVAGGDDRLTFIVKNRKLWMCVWWVMHSVCMYYMRMWKKIRGLRRSGSLNSHKGFLQNK